MNGAWQGDAQIRNTIHCKHMVRSLRFAPSSYVCCSWLTSHTRSRIYHIYVVNMEVHCCHGMRLPGLDCAQIYNHTAEHTCPDVNEERGRSPRAASRRQTRHPTTNAKRTTPPRRRKTSHPGAPPPRVHANGAPIYARSWRCGAVCSICICSICNTVIYDEFASAFAVS